MAGVIQEQRQIIGQFGCGVDHEIDDPVVIRSQKLFQDGMVFGIGGNVFDIRPFRLFFIQ